MVAYLEKLQQPNGLFFHAPDVPFYWGRGDGWVAVGMAELLRDLPAKHQRCASACSPPYRKMMATLLKHQADNGMWRQLIDHPESWEETSSTRHVHLRVRHRREERLAARRNLWTRGAQGVDRAGRVPHAGRPDLREVCVGTGKKNDLQHYLDRPRVAGDTHGQAPMLWTATRCCDEVMEVIDELRLTYRWGLPIRGGNVKRAMILLARAGVVPCLRAASPNGGPLGDFEAHGDVGSPKIAGYATWNAASQVYTLSAGGVNIWAKRDEFQFAYRRMKGDFIVQAQVEFQGKGVDPHRKAGIMARTSIADFDSAYVDGAVHGDGLTSLQYPQGEGRRHRRRPRCRPPRAPTSSSSSAAATSSSSRPRDSASPSRSREIKDAAERARGGVRRPVPLVAQSRGEGDRGLPQRARDQAREGGLPAVSRLHRQPARGA